MENSVEENDFFLNTRSEYDIHDIIKYYPYFLGDKFERMTCTHEKIYQDRLRSDFTFTDEKNIIIVEVKKGIMDIRMLNQINHYLDRESENNIDKILEGILIGIQSNDPNFKKAIESFPYSISEKYLSLDIPSNPSQIKLCAENNCRKANWYTQKKCNFCGSTIFIKDHFAYNKKLT